VADVSEFESEALLNVVVDPQSLREARNDVEQSLGSVSVGVENGRARARSDGGTALAGAGAVEELGDQTDILEDILDELETANSGLIGGGGGGGGGLGVPTVVPGGGGSLAKILRLGAGATALPLAGAGILSATRDDVDGLSEGIPASVAASPLFFGSAVAQRTGELVGADAPPRTGGKKTLAPGVEPSGSLLSGDTTIEDLRKRSKELRESAAGDRGLENKLQLDVTDRQLIQRLVDRGKIEADSTLARLAENDNREFSLNADDRELFERVLVSSRQSNPPIDVTNTDQSDSSTPTSSVEVGRIADQLPPSVRDAASTFLGGAARPFDLPASGSGSGSDTPQRVTLDVGPIELPVDSRRIDQKIDELGAQLKEETKREIRRELTTDVGGR